MVFVDLHLHASEKARSVEELFKKYSSNIDYVAFLKEDIKPFFIQHADFEAAFEKNRVTFIVKRGNTRRFNLFIGLFFQVKKLNPAVVVMHGMITPWRLIIAKIIFGARVKLIVQNHAERPFKRRIKLAFQKFADRFVSAYLFVSKTQAEPWIKEGVIKNKEKIFEVMEGSTSFLLKDSKLVKSAPVFLWVGRLDLNKDPLTILKAFNRYAKHHAEAQLWMVYGTTGLLKEIRSFIDTNELSQQVKLIGQVKHEELESYYNTADYFILGSHYEGSGYSLCEAMACACVPIVTKIPSFMSMTDNGACGYLFEPGNAEELSGILMNLDKDRLPELRKKVLEKFEKDLSFKAIGSGISDLIERLSVSAH